MDKLAKLQGDLKNASERMKVFFFFKYDEFDYVNPRTHSLL